jgi:photosystem II cytochrome c550
MGQFWQLGRRSIWGQPLIWGQIWRTVAIGLFSLGIWAIGDGVIGTGAIGTAAIAAPDPYVTQFLKVPRDTSAIMPMDAAGTNQEFTYAEFVEGKELFGQNCLSCHVGGTTLSSPDVSLALTALQTANPPLDTVNALIQFMRHPVAHDGSDENYACREVSEDWLNQAQVEKIAAFLLRAAQYAKGWGTARF